uniref:Retrovirus-related Pol polyprotein from transposon 17.6 n=1 Tax=Lygus hesperus TaxID=30085 RepID=A0A0A9X0W2_LYGHE
MKNQLITPSTSIPLQYLGVDTDNSYHIDARSIQQVKLKIQNVQNGDAILPYTKLKTLEIPQSLISVKNHEAFVRITNPSEQPTCLTQRRPLMVEKLEENFSSNLNNYVSDHFNFQFDISKLRLDHMNEEEKSAIINLVTRYSDIFHRENEPLSFTNQVKHVIKTSDETPVYARNYRFPEAFKNEVDIQINEMIDQGIVRHSNSPWNAPIWIVPKKMDASGIPKFRIVIDYRKLNDKTMEDKYPMPAVSELVDKLGRCQYFSTIDLK